MQTQITVDWVLIIRCLGAVCWGVALAAWLQYHHLGQFLARERTWITVVIGVGVDLLIGINAAWYEIWLIVVLSSLGIIARSLVNEHTQTEPALNRYTVKWRMEDAIDRCGDVITHLETALDADTETKRLGPLSRALKAAHQAQRHITAARYGDGKTK